MPLPTIRQGSKGAAVKYAQERLSKRGYRLTLDGIFGPGTVAAVRQFQAAEGLTPDGVVGARTWAVLQVETIAPEPEDLVSEERERLISHIPADAPDLVRKVLTLACNDLGKKEQPKGSNEGPQINHLVRGYNQYWWVLKDSVDVSVPKARGYVLPEECKPAMAWCGMAVTNWIRMGLGLPYWDLKDFAKPLDGHPFEKFLGGPGPVEDWAQARGSWVELRTYPGRGKLGEPIPAGAAFTINRAWSNSDPSTDPRAGHIGLVVADQGDGTVLTIEGNVSDGVGSYSRKKSDLRGYATWW